MERRERVAVTVAGAVEVVIATGRKGEMNLSGVQISSIGELQHGGLLLWLMRVTSHPGMSLH